MGKYSNLKNGERRVILDVAKVASRKVASGKPEPEWLLPLSKGGSCLIAVDGEEGDNIDVPGSELLFVGLERKGFLTLGRRSQNSLKVRTQQPAFDYLKYASKTPFGRWFEDLLYDLAHEDTIRSKIGWLLVGVILGRLPELVSLLLGWI